MFYKHHFEDIAKVIRELQDMKLRIILHRKFSEIFEQSNKNFDKDKFADACNVNIINGD